MAPASRIEILILRRVSATGLLSLSLRSSEELGASIGCSTDEVTEAIDLLVNAGLIVRQYAGGEPDALTGRRSAAARITLAGEQVLDSSL